MPQESFQNEARRVSLVAVELGRCAWRINFGRGESRVLIGAFYS